MAKAAGRLEETDQLLDELSGPQLNELAAFDRIEGIDNSANFQRLEHILCLGFSAVTNAMLVKGEVHPGDFAPPARFKVQKKQEIQTASLPAQKAFLRHIATLHNSLRSRA